MKRIEQQLYNIPNVYTRFALPGLMCLLFSIDLRRLFRHTPSPVSALDDMLHPHTARGFDQHDISLPTIDFRPSLPASESGYSIMRSDGMPGRAGALSHSRSNLPQATKRYHVQRGHGCPLLDASLRVRSNSNMSPSTAIVSALCHRQLSHDLNAAFMEAGFAL